MPLKYRVKFVAPESYLLRSNLLVLLESWSSTECIIILQLYLKLVRAKK